MSLYAWDFLPSAPFFFIAISFNGSSSKPLRDLAMTRLITLQEVGQVTGLLACVRLQLPRLDQELHISNLMENELLKD